MASPGICIYVHIPTHIYVIKKYIRKPLVKHGDLANCQFGVAQIRLRREPHLTAKIRLACVRKTALIIHGYRRAQSTVGYIILRQVVLNQETKLLSTSWSISQ